jgi:DNA-binding NtrC family response regulator
MRDTSDIRMAIPDFTESKEIYMKEEKLKKVFIIEDNEMHSMMMDYLLTRENSFSIFRFKSGEECLRKLNLRPDIIILDYGLPGINGLETFTLIKNHDPKIPVVVITESRNTQLAQKFLDKGAYDYIVKEPNSFLKLNKVVESLLNTLAEREYLAGNRMTLMLVTGFILLIVLSSIISYLALKH